MGQHFLIMYLGTHMFRQYFLSHFECPNHSSWFSVPEPFIMLLLLGFHCDKRYVLIYPASWKGLERSSSDLDILVSQSLSLFSLFGTCKILVNFLDWFIMKLLIEGLTDPFILHFASPEMGSILHYFTTYRTNELKPIFDL